MVERGGEGMLLGAQVEVNGLVVTVLKKGSYFGEVGLLRNCRRTASVRALSETCDLFVLTKVTLQPCHVLHPCHLQIMCGILRATLARRRITGAATMLGPFQEMQMRSPLHGGEVLTPSILP